MNPVDASALKKSPLSESKDISVGNKKRKADEAELSDREDIQRRKIENVAEVVLINAFSEGSLNKVWMNHEQAKQLFRNTTPSRQYIRIADRVYLIGINNHLPKGVIGVNKLQNEALEGSLFFRHQTPHVWISRYSASTELSSDLESVEFEIRHYSQGIKNSIIDISLFTKTVSSFFQHHIIALNQELQIAHQQEQFILNVKKMRVCPPQPPKFFGNIIGITSLKFSTTRDSAITLTDRIISINQTAHFNVTLNKRDMVKNHESNPTLVDIMSLQEKLLDTFGSQAIIIGQKWKISINPHLVVTVNLTEGVANGKSYLLKNSRKPQYAFDFVMKPHIHFNPSPEIILTCHETYEAKIIDLEIFWMDDHPNCTPPAKELAWVDISALQTQLYTLSAPIYESQTLPFALGDKKLLASVTEVDNLSYPEISKKVKGSVGWQINPQTDIRFYSRRSIALPLIDNDIPVNIEDVSFQIQPKNTKGRAPKIRIDEKDLIEAIKTQIKTPFLKNQTLVIYLPQARLELIVHSLAFESFGPAKPKYGRLGTISDLTNIKIINDTDDFEIYNTCLSLRDDPVKKLEEYKLAALSEEFITIIRSIYIHRVFKDQTKKLQIPVEKGLLLYGPPGNGKTRLAIALADILGCGEKSGRLKKISGTEIFERWVGTSESNVRELFEPAFQDYEKYKDESELHVLLIDEIDALLPKRREDRHRVDNNVVNQFLSCLDGLNSLSNILVIGTTNSLELIDPAALRFGRLGKHIEIKAPSVEGRKAIFDVHTLHLKKLGRIDPKVNFDFLAKQTENFSGADIAGVVSEAAQYSLERFYHLRFTPEQCESENERLITQKDFDRAIEETKKKKGFSSEPSSLSYYS
jgi:SpoVK/Ycf46/Vps4 family AAA+-type ATPase